MTRSLTISVVLYGVVLCAVDMGCSQEQQPDDLSMEDLVEPDLGAADGYGGEILQGYLVCPSYNSRVPLCPQSGVTALFDSIQATRYRQVDLSSYYVTFGAQWRVTAFDHPYYTGNLRSRNFMVHVQLNPRYEERTFPVHAASYIFGRVFEESAPDQFQYSYTEMLDIEEDADLIGDLIELPFDRTPDGFFRALSHNGDTSTIFVGDPRDNLRIGRCREGFVFPLFEADVVTISIQDNDGIMWGVDFFRIDYEAHVIR